MHPMRLRRSATSIPPCLDPAEPLPRRSRHPMRETAPDGARGVPRRADRAVVRRTMHGLHAARCLQPAGPATALPRTRGDHGISTRSATATSAYSASDTSALSSTAANTRSVRNAFCDELHPDPQSLAWRRRTPRTPRRSPRTRPPIRSPVNNDGSADRPAERPERLRRRSRRTSAAGRSASGGRRGTRRAATRRSGRTSRARRPATLGSRPNPNHSRNSGASATIGIVCDVTSSGSTARRTDRRRGP